LKGNESLRFKERSYLCTALRAFIGGTDCPAIPEPLDWDRFERIVAVNGLVPIIQSTLLNLSQVPENRQQTWKHASIGVLLKNRQYLKAAVKMFRILESEGIAAVSLRGLAMAYWIYPDPALRPMSDVDILVPTDAKEGLLDRLRLHGLSPCKIRRYQLLYEIDNCLLEIHWSYLTTKRFRKTADFGSWIASRRQMDTSEGAIYHLTPENELLDLICHMSLHHEMDSLLKFVDVAMLVQKEAIDWNAVRVWCEGARMTRLVHFSLAVVDHLFGTDLSSRLTSLPRHVPGKKEQMYEAYVSRLFGRDQPIYFCRRMRIMLWIAERPLPKLRQILRFLSLDVIGELLTLLIKRARPLEGRYPFRNVPKEKEPSDG